MVVRPIVRYLLDKNYIVTVATRTKAKADEMIAGHPNGRSIAWTVEQETELDGMIADHDLTVSLLPYLYHVMVAKKCIRLKKNMLTTSYVKPEMRALDAEAKAAGIIILNELGLDPGIDHMSAMRIIDHVHGKGGRVEEFYSFCGALVAPEVEENPFHYKFTWAPKGVVMAGNNDGNSFLGGLIEPVFVGATVDSQSRTFTVTVNITNNFDYDLTLNSLSADVKSTQDNYHLVTISLSNPVTMFSGEAAIVTVNGYWSQEAENFFLNNFSQQASIDVMLDNILIDVNGITVESTEPFPIGNIPLSLE